MSGDNISNADTQISMTPSQQEPAQCPLCDITVSSGGLGRHLRNTHNTADLTAPWNMRLKGHERYVRCEGCTRICAGTRGLGYHLNYSTCTNQSQLDTLYSIWIPIRGVSRTRITQRGRHSTLATSKQKRQADSWTSFSSSDESERIILQCSSCGQKHKSNQCPHYPLPRGNGLGNHNDTLLESERTVPSSYTFHASLPGDSLRSSHFVEHPVTGNGNCLISAVKDALVAMGGYLTHRISAKGIRLQVVQWMRDHPTHTFIDGTSILQQIISSTNGKYASVLSYCDQMAKCLPADWGGETEFLVLIIMYTINIHVYLPSQTGVMRIKEYNGNQSNARATVRLLYAQNRSHYNWLGLTPAGHTYIENLIARQAAAQTVSERRASHSQTSNASRPQAARAVSTSANQHQNQDTFLGSVGDEQNNRRSARLAAITSMQTTQVEEGNTCDSMSAHSEDEINGDETYLDVPQDTRAASTQARPRGDAHRSGNISQHQHQQQNQQHSPQQSQRRRSRARRDDQGDHQSLDNRQLNLDDTVERSRDAPHFAFINPRHRHRPRGRDSTIGSEGVLLRMQFSVSYLIELRAQFMQPLYRLHHTWRRPMVEIITKCFQLAAHADASIRTISFSGFLILPGLLVELLRRFKKTRENVISFLRQTASSTYPGHLLVKRADDIKHERDQEQAEIRSGGGRVGRDRAERMDAVQTHHNRARHDEDSGTDMSRAQAKATAITRLAAQAEQRVRETRLSAAAVIVGTIAERMDDIIQTPPPTLPEQIQKIDKLNPQADENDLLPYDQEDPEGLLVTYETVMGSVRGLNRHSSQGSSGWLNFVIVNLLTVPDREDNSATGGPPPLMRAAGEAFTRVVNMALSGSMHTDVASIWAVSRAVLIPKNDGTGGWRPLGIGESWYRLLGRIAIRAQSRAVGEQLLPIQFAVGVSSGCEIAARTAQIILDNNIQLMGAGAPQMGLIAGDQESAFQTMCRRDIFDGLMEYAPPLVRLFRTFYSSPAALYFGSGTLAGHNSTGVRQGDPPASLYYSVGYHKRLIELDRVMKEVAAEINSELPAGIIAYADDTTGYIEEKGLHLAAKRMREVCMGTRMKFNLSKSKIIVHEGRKEGVPDLCNTDEAKEEENVYLDTQLEVVEGKIVLGNPIGGESYRKQVIKQSVEEMWKPFKGLMHIDPRSALAIMRYCYNARPTFLTRVAEYRLYEEVMGRFDSERDKTIAAIAQTTLTMAASIKCSLPLNLGGLGLRNHKGPAAELGCINSRAVTARYIAKYKQELQRGMLEWSEMARGQARESIYDMERWQGGEEVAALSHLREAEVSLLLHPDILSFTAEHKKKWMRLWHHFWNNGRNHWAARLLSDAHAGNGTWLLWAGGIDGRFKFTTAEFIECLRLALCVDPFPLPQTTQCFCRPSHPIPYAKDPLHPMLCWFHNPHRQHRHNALRNELADLLRTSFTGGTIHAEHYVGERNERGRMAEYFADIYVQHDTEIIIIDTSIVDPSSAKAMEVGGSDVEAGAAAERRAKEKWKEFREVMIKTSTRGSRERGSQVPAHTTGIIYIPCIMETTGKLGAEAEKFLIDRVSPNHPEQVLHFLAKARVNVARWGARMVMEARNRLGWSGQHMQTHREALRRRFDEATDRYDRADEDRVNRQGGEDFNRRLMGEFSREILVI